MTWAVALAVVLSIVFLALAQYARKETVVGYLTPTSGTAKIFTPQHGTIKEIFVTDGQDVDKGEPLLTVETDQIAADGMDVNATVLATLVVQKDRLSKQITAEEQRVTSEQERLAAQIDSLGAEISHLQTQIQIQGERIRIEAEFTQSGGPLSRQHIISEIDFKRRQVALLEQQQNLSALQQQLTARRSQQTEARHTLQQLPTVMAERIETIRNELAATEQRIAETRGRRAYVIRAPNSGRVTTLQATIGQTADPRRLQLEIIPHGSVLQAELHVPARAIGFVQPGQDVRILYDAFPYQNFGTYSGRVKKISQTILTSADASGPIALKEPAYRVTVTLDRPDIDAYGKKIPLQPDMLLKADIILDTRPLLSWLLAPLLSARM